MNTEALERLKQWAQIASSLAVPVVLAVVGWLVQGTLSDAGLKKDYVQIALAVLKEAPTKENEQLRLWAIAVLDKNSPVSIPPQLRQQLATTSGVSNFRLSAKIQSLGLFSETIECRSAPSEVVVDWLVATFPHQYTRCTNPKEVGVIAITVTNIDSKLQRHLARRRRDSHAVRIRLFVLSV